MGGVGDGGLSWMKRAYQRCVEQAKEEKRSLEDVATEKYGVICYIIKSFEVHINVVENLFL